MHSVKNTLVQRVLNTKSEWNHVQVIHAVILHVLILAQAENRIQYVCNTTHTCCRFVIAFDNGNVLLKQGTVSVLCKKLIYCHTPSQGADKMQTN
jgi:hypothetical protein